jgi:hypothetical protein
MKLLSLATLGLIMAFTVNAEEILYIGDSHSHIRAKSSEQVAKRFGNIFVEGMKERGVNVSYYAACGSSPIGWVKGASTSCGYTEYVGEKFINPTQSNFPSVKNIYLPQVHSKIIINLGDNMFDWKIVSGKRIAALPSGTVERGVKSFLATIPHINESNCAWIGPTYHIEGSNYRKSNSMVDEFYSQLEVALRDKCHVIDSRPMVDVTVPNDGLHHVNSDSQAWASGVLASYPFH